MGVAEDIPIVDISVLFGAADELERTEAVERIARACGEVGFFCVTGADRAAAQAEGMRAAVRRVFEVDEAEKHRQAITRQNYRGYIPYGFFTPNDGAGAPDRYEGYKLHAETALDDSIRAQCPLYGPNLWPDHAPEVRETVLTYWRALDELAMHLLSALAEGVGCQSALLTGLFVKPLTNMTLLHYPPQEEDEAGFGIHPHKDTDALTIIASDSVGGLEVLTRGGQWIGVDCPPDGFVVNIGDMLQTWSGGRYVSTPHRVVNRSGRERYSFPYFMVPQFDVTIEPILPPLPGFDCPAVNCGHWSAEIWRTNWADQNADDDTPTLGTVV